MQIHTIRWTIAVALAGCAAPPPPAPSPPTDNSAGSAAERRTLAQEECEAQGGSIMGDIGDGATHRPDYVCPSGKRPLGNLAQPQGGAIAVEGAVCCPR